jgi:hypothetical protein
MAVQWTAMMGWGTEDVKDEGERRKAKGERMKKHSAYGVLRKRKATRPGSR